MFHFYSISPLLCFSVALLNEEFFLLASTKNKGTSVCCQTCGIIYIVPEKGVNFSLYVETYYLQRIGPIYNLSTYLYLGSNFFNMDFKPLN